jgi:hypothetical protein
MEPNWGGWSIDKKLYDFIRQVLPDGSTILELGSGWTTGELAKNYKMYSVENDIRYLDKYETTYIFAPSKKHEVIENLPYTKWYDPELLKSGLKGIEYDLLLIDGPHKTRSGFVKYMSYFDPSAIWLFDDTQRPADAMVADFTAAKLGAPCATYKGSDEKTFTVINSPLLADSNDEDGDS